MPFTLRGLVGELADRGLRVDCRTVWAFVHRTGYSFKKRRRSPKSRPARTQAAAVPAGSVIKTGSTDRVPTLGVGSLTCGEVRA